MTLGNSKQISKSNKKIIGRRETVDLPEWELYEMDAKVDTGAYTSSLHCHHIELHEDDNGFKKVRFNLLDPSHEAYNDKLFTLPIFDEKDVKSSNAQKERRYIVKTSLILFGSHYDIELSLTDRTEMKYPILLGRRFLRKKFIVDVSKVNVSLKKSVKQ